MIWQMMEEIFLHLSGPNSALPAMVQILADFASADRRLSNFLSIVLYDRDASWIHYVICLTKKPNAFFYFLLKHYSSRHD